MSCNTCGSNTCPDDKCLSSLTFRIDEGFLVPRLNGVPLEPLDLRDISAQSETNTYLELDAINGRLVYTSENAVKGVNSPDMIPVSAIANLMNVSDLQDVNYQVATNGDILSWDGTQWTSYTVPAGDVVTPVGVDADGRLVKSGSPDPIQSPDTVPLGGILIWPMELTDIPASYRECNGQALSRSVYAPLFAKIGTKYGAGDGATSFNLPNMQTRTVAGLSSTGTIDTQFNVIGQTGGEKVHLLTVDEMPRHRHRPGETGQFVLNKYPNSASWRENSTNGSMDMNGGQYTAYEGGGQPHNNLPPYITMPYIMRVI